jgi:hypothetical protein
MASFQFLHLGVNFKTRTATTENLREIEALLDNAKDWYRYAPNCWLIYTSKNPETWHERLKSIPWMQQQTYLICVVDLDEKSGWLGRSTWDWINKDRRASQYKSGEQTRDQH